MFRALLEFVLMLVVARSFWRVVGGVVEGLGGAPRSRVPSAGPPPQGVPMARDPVCGTFVLPDRAISLGNGQRRVYFCSSTCRDAYQRDLAARRAEGRTA